MAKTLTFGIPADEAAEIEVTLVGLTEAMRLANEHMGQEQLEIERLKKETRQIAVETRQIGEQTRQALAQLETAF